MNRLRIYGALISALILLAACTSPLPPVPTPTPTRASATIGYGYVGGWLGFDRQLTIAPDGTAFLNDWGEDVGTIKLTPERMKALVERFDQVDFYNLKENYEDKDHIVSDDTYSTLTLTQGDRTKSVTVAMARGSDLAPKALMDLIAELRKIGEEVEKGATPSP